MSFKYIRECFKNSRTAMIIVLVIIFVIPSCAFIREREETLKHEQFIEDMHKGIAQSEAEEEINVELVIVEVER